MSGLIDSIKRLRPGSGAGGPISVTEGAEHLKKSRAPGNQGMSAPGFNDRPFANDGISWPVALSTSYDADHGVVADPESDDDEERTDSRGDQMRPFARHDPDDEEVLSKLFHLDL